MTAVYRRRLIVNRVNLVMSLGTMAFGMMFLLWILWVLFAQGFAALSPTLFTQMTPPPGSAGGLANAIYGSVLIVAVATFISTPIGILAGIYLAEYGKDGRIASLTRFINDILLSAPSIVIGLFVYTVYVMQVGHFSGWAGSFALALIAIPVVVRTTENMLHLVPASLARSGGRARRADVEGDPAGDAEGRPRRRHHRRSARRRADVGRNRAALVHRAQQPVLDRRT